VSPESQDNSEKTMIAGMSTRRRPNRSETMPKKKLEVPQQTAMTLAINPTRVGERWNSDARYGPRKSCTMRSNINTPIVRESKPAVELSLQLSCRSTIAPFVRATYLASR
jgi:hypothetical protein